MSPIGDGGNRGHRLARPSDMRRILPILVLALGLASCRGEATEELPSPADSGIRGVVTSGPQCPVVQAGSPCPDEPWEGRIDITAGSDLVATVSTFDGGRFSIAIDPGTYRVQPRVEGPGTAPPMTVEVPVQGYVEVAFTVDTGIR